MLLILMNTANLFSICFATPKLNRATPNGVATRSLRSLGLDNTYLDHPIGIKLYLNTGRTVDLHKTYTMWKEQKVRREKL